MSGVVQVKDVVQVEDVAFTYDAFTGIGFKHDGEEWNVEAAYLNKGNTVFLQVEDDGGNIEYYLVKVNDKSALKKLKNQLKQRKLIMKKPSNVVKQMATWQKNGFRIALRL